MRIDRWIWAVRMVRTRSIATRFCKGGKVLLNDRRAKPASIVRENDIVEVRYSGFSKIYRVLGLLERRVGAREAADYFEDLSPPRRSDPLPRPPRREKGSGRPTKRERRELERLRGED